MGTSSCSQPAAAGSGPGVAGGALVSAVSSAGRGSRGGGTALAAVPSPGGWPGLVCCCLWGWGSSELGPEQLGEPAARAGGAHSQSWGQSSSCSPLGGEGEEISLGARSRQQHSLELPAWAGMSTPDPHPQSLLTPLPCVGTDTRPLQC